MNKEFLFGKNDTLLGIYKDFYQERVENLRKQINSPLKRNFVMLGREFVQPDLVEHLINDERTEQCNACSFHYSQKCRVLANAGINPEEDLALLREISLYSMEFPEHSVPHNLHYVWSSARNSFDIQMSQLNVKTIQHTLHNISADWKIYIWTNNPMSIPSEISSNNRIIIKSYYDEFPLHRDLFQKLSIAVKTLSPLSDLVRYLVLAKFGGLYLDTDYRLCKPIDKLIESFDFVIGMESRDFAAGGFIASAPEHPIVLYMIETIVKNLNPETAENHVKRACDDLSLITFATGPVALNIAFYKKANLRGNKDIILTRGVLLDARRATGLRCKIKTSDDMYCDYLKESSYGNDAYSGSWLGRSSGCVYDTFIETLGKDLSRGKVYIAP